MGLGKENALKNTVHPMAFVQENVTEGASQVAVTSSTVAVASAAESAKPPVEESEEAPKNAAPSEPEKIENVLPAEEPKDDSKTVLDAPAPVKPVETPVAKPEPVKPETPVAPVPTIVEKPVQQVSKPFADVPKNVAYRAAFDRLLAAGALEPLSSDKFRPNDSMTRRDAAIVLGELLGVTPSDFPALPYSDVLPSDASAGYLDKLLDLGVVGKAEKFRPNDAISRAEAAVLLVRASKLPNVLGHSLFKDVANDDTRVGLLNAFSVRLKLKKNVKFQPNAPLSRAEFVKMADTWRQKTGLLK